MSGDNICFHGEIRKIIFELSLITPLIWSSALSSDATHIKNSKAESPCHGLHCFPTDLSNFVAQTDLPALQYAKGG